MTNSYLITINTDPRISHPRLAFASFVPLAPALSFGMIERGEGGMSLSESTEYLNLPRSLRPSCAGFGRGKGISLISCGYCRSGKTVMTISQSPDGSHLLSQTQTVNLPLEVAASNATKVP